MRSPFGLSMKVTGAFFDRQAVIDATDRAERKVLSRFGAFTRRGARSSIRRRKRSAKPGGPPSAHSRDKTVTLKNILFAYDSNTRSVVIGPVRLNGRKGNVPRLLEEGGRTTLIRRRYRRGQRVLIREPATYHKFPYMGPAFQKELPKVPQMWAGSVKA